MDRQKNVADYLHCLSILEEKVALLYNNLSDRIESPARVKSLLHSIAKDSAKHSKLIGEVADNISSPNVKPADCAKKFGEVWSTMRDCLKVVEENQLDAISFGKLLSMLDILESSFGEEYHIFVQMQTFRSMAKEINKLYDINFTRVKPVFERILVDEMRHKEMIGTIKKIIGEISEEKSNTPKVKYQNPNAWSGSLPPATYAL